MILQMMGDRDLFIVEFWVICLLLVHFMTISLVSMYCPCYFGGQLGCLDVWGDRLKHCLSRRWSGGLGLLGRSSETLSIEAGFDPNRLNSFIELWPGGSNCIRGAEVNGNFWIGRKVPSLHSDVQEYYARGFEETLQIQQPRYGYAPN